ncbi:MAG: VCBS repeat-containing protein [Prevotella sp.]|nr:VCBS repeat-containing protein [Prevotella sp.]
MKLTTIKTLSWAIFALMIPIQASADEGDSIRTITPLFPPVVLEDSMPDISKFQDSNFLSFENTDTDDASKSAASDTLSVRSGNTKVGTPTTNGSVSPMGAAVWSMAFDTPKGVGGMTPTVGLAYSSQSGIGNAGWGVGISGFSYITRGTKTLYHDGTVQGVKYDTDDALFLDNRRLLLSSGTEGLSGAIYVPEGDPFTKVKITSYSSTSGPLSFEVTSPNGMVSFYGSTPNARLAITVGSSTRCHSWYVSRQEDPNGNYVEYSYMQDNLTVYPEAITYGKNKYSGAGADNQIKFYYTNAHSSTVRTFVIGGTQGSVQKCLERVQTKTGSSVYREYALSYAPISDGSTLKYERLSSITCRNGAGEEMNPITLEWSLLTGTAHTAEILDVSTEDNYSMIQKQDSLLLAADLNGDGLADIIRISNCKLYTNAQSFQWHTYVYVHRSVRDVNGVVTYLPHLRYDLGAQVDFDDWKEHIGNNIVADIDGDGLNDLVIPFYTELPSSTPQLYFRCILGKNVKNSSLTINDYTLSMMAADDIPPFVSGDIDGNGLEDLISFENKKSNGYYYLDISFSVPSGPRNSVHIPLTLPQQPKRLFVGDCNSDGLPDLIALYDGGHKIFYNNGGSNASSFFSNANSTTGSSFGNMWRVEQGDFNGDGLADFVYVGGNSADYYFAMNNGNGSFSVSHAITYDIHDQATDRDDHRFTLTPIDIDRDGLTDLVISKADFEHEGGLFPHNVFYRTIIGWLVSNGSTLSEVRFVTSYDLIEEAGSHNIMVADFDGDGWPELANNGADWYTNTTAYNDGCHIRVYHSTGFSPSSGKLTTTADALGAVTSFTYGTSSDPDLYTQVYDSSDSTTFPLADIHTPLVLVSAMTRNGGLTGTHTTAYRYANLKAHLQGKGLLGFLDVAARDNRTGVTTQSGTWVLNTTHYVPSMAYSITSMGYDNDSTTTTISVQSNSASRYMTFPVTKRNVDMDGNVTTTSTGYNVIDGYVTVERTEYGSANMYKQVSYTNHVKKGNRWLPRTITKSQKHADAPSAYSSTTFITYSTTGNPTTVVEHYGSGNPLTTSTTYDTFGNALSVSRTGQGVSTFSDNQIFDSTGRFVTRRYRTPNGEDCRFTYDTWGNVLTETDAAEASNLLTTTYQRDSWGDVLSITNPMGNV